MVSIALATICFTYNGNSECHPALVGKNSLTPVGEFSLNKRITTSEGYGGDILQFHETSDTVYAIHRLWLLRPGEHREERLYSNNLNDRYISSGCINVSVEVYEKLVSCCSNDKLVIK
jgi:signal peptidase I